MTAVEYEVTPQRQTRIRQYNQARPFANFFPAVAGLRGVPAWAFFVNRGQCISAFGTGDRNHAMLDFASANVAYRDTPRLGFRTFLKVSAGGGSTFYEPFRPSAANAEMGCRHEMTFDPAALELYECNPALGIETSVVMATVPGQTFPGLMRRVTVVNTGQAPAALEWVDGLPWVTCYGIDLPTAKLMTYTSKSWISVQGVQASRPYYQLRCMMSDTPDLEYYDSGNFALQFDVQGLLPAIVDPEAVFGPNTDLDHPDAFAGVAAYEPPGAQVCENQTPSAMTFLRVQLPPGQKKTLWSVYGCAEGQEELGRIAQTVTASGWFEDRLEENRRIVGSLLAPVGTFSKEPVFDAYCRQTYLDNVLRGGTPVLLPDAAGRKRTFHVFSRIHGDMERDYNAFQIEPAFWSQGNGGYRDVLQNRRNDAWFTPQAGLDNIRMFMNLIRLDGYNPHGLLGSEFVLSEAGRAGELAAEAGESAEDIEALAALISQPFTPGEVLTAIARRPIRLRCGDEEFLGRVLAESDRRDLADPVSGFWTDHWHYNLDSIESYLSLYPDRLAELLVADRTYTYFQSPAKVRPRHERYVLRNGEPFQARAVETPGSEEDEPDPRQCIMRTDYGRGEPYRTNLLAKLFSLVVVKMASLDPHVCGIEMEAGRPNWNDSLNGLPGLFGSSTCETLELRRLVRFCLDAVAGVDVGQTNLPTEVGVLMQAVDGAVEALGDRDEDEALFSYWDRTNTAKEHFRQVTRDGISGAEAALGVESVSAFLGACLKTLDGAIRRSTDPQTGLIHSYFRHEMTEYDRVQRDGRETIQPRAFRQIPTAPFLEGPMHYLRVLPDRAAAQHAAVKASGLYDEKLGMYKVCASLAEEPHGLGRIVVFSPGWLERESIWLHMEYKYLLELLRCGLWEEFKGALDAAVVCFQPPERYGRSVLENSSFLVCSDNPNPADHGRGFYARLSGSTAEWVHIWLHMALGPRPFGMEDGELVFSPRPHLPARLFAETSRSVEWLRDGQTRQADLPAGHYAFVMLSRTLVVYVNPTGRDTVGEDAAGAVRVDLLAEDGSTETVAPDAIRGDRAGRVRDGAYAQITVWFE